MSDTAGAVPQGGGGGLAGMPRRWPAAGGAASSGFHGAGYVCRRCGKPGHFLPNCPTNGDPAYENKPQLNQKLMNTSTGSRKIVATLEGIETKNKTVILNNQGFIHRIVLFYSFYFSFHHIVFATTEYWQVVP